MHDPKDWQRDEVYQWEWKWRSWSSTSHTMKGLKTWIQWACARYGLECPKVTKHSAKKDPTCWYDNKKNLISLSTNLQNIAVSLHEAAHYIAYKHFGDMSHGKHWLGIYLHLLESARIAPKAALIGSVDAEGLIYVKNLTPKKVYKLKTKKARKDGKS